MFSSWRDQRPVGQHHSMTERQLRRSDGCVSVRQRTDLVTDFTQCRI